MKLNRNWQVTLTSTHAACAYKGAPQRSMRAAYRAALGKASKQFLSYRDTAYPHSDLDYQPQWDAVFAAVQKSMNRSRYSRVEQSDKGLYVAIARTL